ncbi:MAG: toll/interleukin-1 receptor domain-containing protein [Anaerolineales bacterium]
MKRAWLWAVLGGALLLSVAACAREEDTLSTVQQASTIQSAEETVNAQILGSSTPPDDRATDETATTQTPSDELTTPDMAAIVGTATGAAIQQATAQAADDETTTGGGAEEIPTEQADEESPQEPAPPGFGTQVAVVAPPTSVEAALIIVNTSGQEIGDGVFRVYSSTTELRPSESVRVELELSFRNYYITPTPRGEVMSFPAVTATPGEADALPDDPTPTPLAVSEPDQVFFQRMGASLLCAPESFSGCGPRNDEIINYNGHVWSWILSPVAGAAGLQPLEVQAWTLQSVNGEERVNIVWREDFQLRVLDAAANAGNDDSALPLVLVALALGGVAFLGVMASQGPSMLRWWRARHLKVFVSYRRADSAAWATLITDALIERFGRGAVFRDIEQIEYGDDFAQAIDQAMEASTVLIAVIGKYWLSITETTEDGRELRRLDNPRDFVRREIAAALAKDLRVIPALVDGAQMPGADDLPEELKPLARCNTITIRNDSSADDIARLVRALVE